MIKEQIEKQLQKILSELSVGAKDLLPVMQKIAIAIPSDALHGDYTTNVALIIAKQLKRSPLDIAQEISAKLKDLKMAEFEKIEAVKPGFINFYLSKNFLIDEIKKTIQSPEKIGKGIVLERKKIMVEFTDPNPFKEFHIGHLYSNIVGESLCRLMESQGAEVKRVCYQGDVGLHVARAIWGMKEKLRITNDELRILEEKSLNEKVKFLGESYAYGAAKYEDDEKAKGEIIAINKFVYTKENTEVNAFYDVGRKWSLEYFDLIYQRLGTKFWKNYFESEAGPVGLEIVKEHIKDGIFEESDGAVVFKGEQYGLHTRVFINSQGLPTYEAKELGLAPTKYKDYPYDVSIIVTANEINEYFRVLIKVLTLINPELGEKTTHVSHGFVRLPVGKMSSRTGNIIAGEWLLDEAVKKATDLASNSVERDEKAALPTPRATENVEIVGIGAVKYAFLKNSIGKDIEFDFHESINLQGNSGPYLQYTYVRTQSIQGKAQNYELRMTNEELNQEEYSLVRLLHQFSEVVEKSAEHLAPSTLATYLYELAKSFNLFYQKHRILDAESEQGKSFRLSLTKATGLTLARGLNLLGIEAPEKM